MRRRWPSRSEDDRKQFLATARVKAKKNYQRKFGDRSAYEAKAARRARIDWDRMAKAERHRRARTKSLESLHREPAVQSFIGQLAATEATNHILDSIELLLGAALRLRYLEDREVSDVAARLGISKQAARCTIQKALREARKVSSR